MELLAFAAIGMTAVAKPNTATTAKIMFFIEFLHLSDALSGFDG
jgi:hypothetical protein